MTSRDDIARALTRRAFFRRSGLSLGSMALASLLRRDAFAKVSSPGGVLPVLHRPARARRVIYLFQSGAPSHIDLFDPKPRLTEMTGVDLPDSVRMGQRITGMTSGQKNLFCVGSAFPFAPRGQCGMEISDALPHISQIADEICLLRAVHTDPINHDPAVTYLFTGHQQPGRPTLGAWASYGLGSENQDLPAFIVLLSGRGGQSLQTRYWGSGFLPSRHQGVQFRGAGDPVLFFSNPPGMSMGARRDMLNDVHSLNRIQSEGVGDPEIETRIEAYEMAFRMQTSVPDLMDLSQEPAETLELYGARPGEASFANNCLLARRLVERGVRFVKLIHRDWDHHGGLPEGIRHQARLTDKASAALVIDLKRRGLLEDTLVVWGGEFGRTSYCQGTLRKDNFGRDHHPRCYSLWLAGGGVKTGFVHGVTDDFAYNIVSGGVHIHDLHATLLHCLGIDHERLTFRFQGRDFRLTDVEGRVVREILA
jgi:hypothetical protein